MRRKWMRVWLGAALLLLTLCGPVWSQSQNVTVQYGIQIGPGHRAILSWTASASSGVTSYKVYRSNISGSAYVVLGSVASPTLTYTDGGLPAGKTYFYVVTAISPGGESSFSNQVTAVVPQP